MLGFTSPHPSEIRYTDQKMKETSGGELRCLIVENEEPVHHGFKSIFDKLQIAALSAYSLTEGKEILAVENFDLVILQENLPDGNGLLMAEQLAESDCTTIVCTESANLRSLRPGPIPAVATTSASQ